jgi:hypothetical protein
MPYYISQEDPPTTLGQFYKGGYYIGDYDAGNGVFYRLIVSPKSSETSAQWKTTNTTSPGTRSLIDGYNNTYGHMDNTNHPAGNFTANLITNGYSDWYLPSINELNFIFNNRNSMPAGEEFISNGSYWSSTESGASFAFAKSFISGAVGGSGKTVTINVRAIRREPVLKTLIASDNSFVHKSFDFFENGDIANTETKLTSFDGAAGDWYGYSVAVGSGRIVIGSLYDDDNSADSGSAYIYDLNGNFIKKIIASDGDLGDAFGLSVSVGSGRIVIGAPYDENDGFPSSGSAYVYDLNGNEIAKLTAFDRANGDNYGGSVTVGSGRILIGSLADDDSTGSVYVYDLNGNFIKKIIAFDGATGDQYGSSVSVGSGRIVIGAHRDDDNGSDSGSAYVYDLNGNLITKLTAYDGASGDSYGYSVSVGSGRIVVGSPNHDNLESAWPAGSADAGAIYIYDLNGNLITKKVEVDFVGAGNGTDLYGWSVSVGSGKIVVGSHRGEALVISSFGNVAVGIDAGLSYVYDLNGNLLTRFPVLYSNKVGDFYGFSVSVGSGRIVIGSHLSGDNGTNSGSAYIYKLQETSDIYYENIIQSMGN